MNTVVKQKWITALRSGEFTQRTGGCVGTDGTCCAIGVLAKVLEKEGLVGIVPTQWGGDLLLVVDAGTSGTHNRLGLPSAVRDSLQLSDGEEDDVIYQNDNSHRSFEQIANYIETNL